MEQEQKVPDSPRQIIEQGLMPKPKFEVSDFPYSQFEKIGMAKKDVLSLPSDVMENLKAGARTSLQNISIKPEGMDNLNLQARLSIKENPDGSLNLNIHPIRKEINNDLGLSIKDIEALQSGKVITKDLPTMNGEMSKSIIQLDRETNELLTTRQRNLIIPDKVAVNLNQAENQSAIQFVSLSPANKEALKKGEEVTLANPRNESETFKINLDLNSLRGFSVVREGGLKEDLNQNGIKDKNELDINRNGIPDKKEKDLNQNGIADRNESTPFKVELNLTKAQSEAFDKYWGYGKNTPENALTKQQYAAIPDVIDKIPLSNNEKFALASSKLEFPERGLSYQLNEKGNIVKDEITPSLESKRSILTNKDVSFSNENSLKPDHNKGQEINFPKNQQTIAPRLKL